MPYEQITDRHLRDRRGAGDQAEPSPAGRRPPGQGPVRRRRTGGRGDLPGGRRCGCHPAHEGSCAGHDRGRRHRPDHGADRRSPGGGRPVHRHPWHGPGPGPVLPGKRRGHLPRLHHSHRLSHRLYRIHIYLLRKR